MIFNLLKYTDHVSPMQKQWQIQAIEDSNMCLREAIVHWIVASIVLETVAPYYSKYAKIGVFNASVRAGFETCDGLVSCQSW